MGIYKTPPISKTQVEKLKNKLPKTIQQRVIELEKKIKILEEEIKKLKDKKC